MTNAVRAGAVLLALASTACLAGLPPTRVDAGFGAIGPAHGPDEARDPGALGSVRAGVFPAQLWESAGGRSVDFGAGYGFDGASNFALHSGYAELDFYRAIRPTRGPVLGIGIAPRIAYDALRGDFGGGASLRFSLDLSRGAFVDEWETHTGDSTAFAAAAWGQASFGFYLEASFVSVGPYAFATGTAGLTCRLPSWGFILI